MPRYGEFSVFQFFPGGTHEVAARNVDERAAVDKFRELTGSVLARIGATVRVIVTDGGDATVLEGVRGQGITFPPELAEGGM